MSQRTGIINQIRAFLPERGVAVRQGLRFLRAELPRILAAPSDVLSPRMVGLIEGLAEDWRRLDQRIERLSGEITAERLVSIPRAAMIAKGWAPATLAALEEAMEPKFLRDMREEDEGQVVASALLRLGQPGHGVKLGARIERRAG